MGITLGMNDEEYLAEGQIKDILKSATKSTTGIDADSITTQWKDIKNNSSGADRVLKSTKMLNDETIGATNKKLQDINRDIDSKSIDNGRSIIARSRNSVLQFPVYITQSIRVNEAQIISKLFERVYTSYVQSALAQNPIITPEEARNLAFLKNFHTNIKESADLELLNEFYTPIDELDAILKESVFHEEWITPDMHVTFRHITTKDMNLISENARLLHEPLQGFSYLKEAKYNPNTKNEDVKSTEMNQVNKSTRLSNKDIENIAMDDANLTDEEKKVYNKSTKDITDELKAQYPDTKDSKGNTKTDPKFEAERKRLIGVKQSAETKVNNAVNKFKSDVKDHKRGDNYAFDGTAFYSIDKTHSKKVTTTEKNPSAKPPVDAPVLLRDADIKKINGMLPYQIAASFRVSDEKTSSSYDVHFIIGIKTVLHLIRTEDLQDDLKDLVTGSVRGLQKVRYKTGEIKFMDYVFNFKGLKADAAKRVNYNKRWLNSLKRLADWNKMHGTAMKDLNDFVFDGEVPIPNATLILSQSDVTILTSNTGIDLSEVSNAKRLAKSLFLIAVAIVDPSAGSMKVLFPDMDTDWDVQSLASIDAEIAKTDNSQIMRELNSIVNHR